MRLPFDQFMRRALYDPQHGYYTRHIAGVGSRGDFTTAPMLGEHLGQAISRWAALALKETKCHHLIEIGPGTGELARQVWSRLPLALRWSTTLHLVETSPRLTQLQQQNLGRRVRWHASPTEALAACQGRAVIYSNELVDAFPVRRFRKTTDGWREIGVEISPSSPLPSSLQSSTFDLGPSTFTECLLEAEVLPDSTIFDQIWHSGQCVEVHESYRDWLSQWLPLWQTGRMLTIDYGAEAKDLYHRQPEGSIRAYLLQQRLTGADIYQNISRQDLTADVNFSDLIAWSSPHLKTLKLSRLADFLPSTAPAPLRDADGAGRAFQVLDQERSSGGKS
ncbi:MAG TPA: SAM-dependent methyltransferase [Luteolibacter sp.]|nr:SAM-dependent methyltransferase [Luteolibacter sp.]